MAGVVRPAIPLSPTTYQYTPLYTTANHLSTAALLARGGVAFFRVRDFPAEKSLELRASRAAEPLHNSPPPPTLAFVLRGTNVLEFWHDPGKAERT